MTLIDRGREKFAGTWYGLRPVNVVVIPVSGQLERLISIKLQTKDDAAGPR